MRTELDFASILPYVDVLLSGLWLTVQLTVASTLLGIALGIGGAAGRTCQLAWVRVAVGAYVEVIRNTPFLVQLFFIYFGISSIGLRLSAAEAALIALTINLGAYATEIIRAGVDAIHKGQIEAARSLGLTSYQTFRHVILLPALEKVYPALASQCIIVMLGSAVVSQISVEEMTFAANFIQSRTFRGFEVYLVITLGYLALSILMRQAFRIFGRYAFPNQRARSTS